MCLTTKEPSNCKVFNFYALFYALISYCTTKMLKPNRKDSAANMAIIRYMALDIVKTYKSSKADIKGKR